MKKITLKTYKRDLPTAFRGSQILKGKLPKPKLPVYTVNTHTHTNTLSKNVNKHTNKSC